MMSVKLALACGCLVLIEIPSAMVELFEKSARRGAYRWRMMLAMSLK